MPPAQIVATLLDEGTYIASESSFYRILAEHGLNKRRGRARKPAPAKARPRHTATAPNHIWAWDI